MTTILLAIHVAGGSAALLSMLIPLLSRKGGVAHRRAGWVYVAGMSVVAVTAFAMSAIRFLTDPTPQGQQFGAFLFFVSILTVAGVSTGIRVLRAKQRTAPHRGLWDVGVSATLTLTSVAAFAYGLASGNSFFTAFSVIGLLTGGGQLAYWLRPPTNRMHWWFEHMGSMLGSCIGATTAFLVTAGPRLGLVDGMSLLVWVAPAIVGGPAIVMWRVYYMRKFSGRGVRQPESSHAIPRSVPAAMLVLALWCAPAAAQPLAVGVDGERSSDRFDVTAKAPAGSQPTMAMLRALLEERLKLRAHIEQREGMVFELTLARKDGRLGPNLSAAKCAQVDRPAAQRLDDLLVLTMYPAPPQQTSGPCAQLRIGAGPTMFGQGILIADLARTLSYAPIFNAPVIDRTGLEGRYDLTLRWRADNNPDPDAGATLPAALQEQLGLTMERAKGTIDVVVVDAVDKLEAN